jgi:aspartate carbamoyltransferase catalytic subunit
MKHLITSNDLSVDDVMSILEVADHMAEINTRANPKVPALRGKTVASVFFEDSTRTRLSFETAAKRLSADTMTFSASSSSVNKGESLRDTIETLSAMGVDAFVVRHKSSGVPLQISQWTDASIVNAGDGWHQHPTQGLLDTFTITRHFKTHDLAGRTIAMVGDIKHSRVARSDIDLFTRLGAKVVLVGPPTLMPYGVDTWPVEVVNSIDQVIGHADVMYMLRMQRERMDSALVPGLGEYTSRFGLTPARAALMPTQSIVMHPGPMNRGVEMVVDPGLLESSRILQQVANGVSVRMAVLFSILGGSGVGALASATEKGE